MIRLLICSRFTRGWTPQELIAPQCMFFLDSWWHTNARGSTKASMIPLLTDITNIDVHLLDGSRLLSSFSVAQKMSWAASRKTTRVEDIAYSLLGIFDLSMPLLYGEGNRAFYRLQEAIMHSTPDLSILAWTALPVPDLSDATFTCSGPVYSRLQPFAPDPRQIPDTPMLSGVLAASPAPFKVCCHYELSTEGDELPDGFTINNIGICIISTTHLHQEPPGGDFLILPVNCVAANRAQLGIRLRQVGSKHYVRTEPWKLFG